MSFTNYRIQLRKGGKLDTNSPSVPKNSSWRNKYSRADNCSNYNSHSIEQCYFTLKNNFPVAGLWFFAHNAKNQFTGKPIHVFGLVYDVRVTTAAGGRQDRPPRTLLHDWLTFCYHFYDLRDWNRLCLCRQRERTEHASRAFGRCRACENSRNTVPGARDPAAATKPYQLEIRATGAAKFTLNLLISYPTKCDSTRGSTKQTHC